MFRKLPSFSKGLHQRAFSSAAQLFQFLHIFTSTWYCQFFILGIPVGVWYSRISLWFSYIFPKWASFPMFIWNHYMCRSYHLHWSIYSTFLPMFSFDITVVSLLSWKSSGYIWIQDLYWIVCLANIFSHFMTYLYFLCMSLKSRFEFWCNLMYQFYSLMVHAFVSYPRSLYIPQGHKDFLLCFLLQVV